MPLFDAISAAGAFYRIRVLMGPTGRAEIGLVTDVREACCVGSFVCWGRVCPECDSRFVSDTPSDPDADAAVHPLRPADGQCAPHRHCGAHCLEAVSNGHRAEK